MEIEKMSGPERYGKYYWLVELQNKTEIYIHADNINITDNGTLLFIRESGLINVAFAHGQWKCFYSASVIDGHPVAVEHIIEDQES